VGRERERDGFDLRERERKERVSEREGDEGSSRREREEERIGVL
jgi:hypothetical protein